MTVGLGCGAVNRGPQGHLSKQQSRRPLLMVGWKDYEGLRDHNYSLKENL